MNQSDSMANLTSVIDFLNSLGYNNFCYIVYQFVLPIIGSIGLILCSFSMYIFFCRKEFKIKMYDYYRCLVVVYWAHLVFGIPYALFFTPRYMPSINTLPWAGLQSFYFTFSNFACHLAGIIEIGIILDRERNFTPLVKKYYMLEPLYNCLIFLIVSIAINLVCAFDFVPGVSGSFYYIDTTTGQKQENTYYWPVFTNFASSYAGYVSTLAVYVIRDLLTLIVGIVLNVISTIHLYNYYKKKRLYGKIQPRPQPKTVTINDPQTTQNNSHSIESLVKNQTAYLTSDAPTTSNNASASAKTKGINSNAAVAEEKKKNLEIKLLIMVVVLCFISILERSILLACNIYGATGLMNDLSLLLGTLVDFVLTLGPAISFFVFYFFNNNFQRAVLNILFGMKVQRDV